jgi:signal transduction histidine kinase
MSAKVKEQTKIALALFIFILGILLTSWYSYFEEKAKINKEIDDKLLWVANSVPLVLDDGFHSRVFEKDSVDGAQDMRNIQKLTKYAELVGVKYVYTVILKDGVLRFTSSSATKEELSTGHNLTRYFDKYDDADPRLFDAFRERKVFYASYQDKWGSFRSVFVPFVSASGEVYVVGADIETGFIDALLQKAVSKWLVGVFIVFSCSAPLVFIYQAALRRRNRHLAQEVQAATQELRELNLSLEKRVAQEIEKSKKQERIISEQLKMAQMGDMMRSIAHHWRQPLTALGLFIQDVVIAYKSGELDGKYIDKFKAKSMEIIYSMSKTIDDFRDFFKLSDKKEEFFCGGRRL